MKKIVSILFLFGTVLTLSAQTQKVKNQPYADQKLLHFGISVGLNFQDVILNNSGLTTETGETWFATIPNYSPGFSVGLLGDLYLNPYMNLRFNPILHFGDKSFEFVEQESDERYITSIRSNYLYIPLDVKFRSMRLNNYRPYVTLGVYAGLDLGRQSDMAVYMKSMDYGITIGIGCDIYLPIIKVAPEIRFSFGLGDIIVHDRTDLTDLSLLKYSNAISSGKTRMISFVFNFE
ncbi:MAG: PorT family protein [Bacteroidales bacterium]|nr:PorT family protein [Bacteroidales bacterium]